jgi:hypothetical protein
LLAIAGVLGGVLLLQALLPVASAQAFFGFGDPESPLIWPPSFRGEVYGRPIWMTLQSGKQTVPALGKSWDLKGQFGLQKTNVYVDSMARVQFNRVSFRIHYEVRDYSGAKAVVTSPNEEAAARFTYTGIRLGGDFDLFQRTISRIGVNLDYDLYSPIFTEGIVTVGGKKLVGDAALTLGFHAAYNPIWSWYGASPLFEVRMRWPVLGSEVTDLELVGGVVAPTTMLGTLSLKVGYRRTDVAMTTAQITDVNLRAGTSYTLPSAPTNFDAIMSGVFAELAYYY